MKRWCGLLLGLLLACRPSESTLLASGSGEGGAPANSGAGGVLEGNVQSRANECPAAPAFPDGAWSVRSLLCARGTLSVGQRFVLRAMPAGGDTCFCPPTVACAPCMPTIIFRDSLQDQLSVTLRAKFPTGLVKGSLADVPVSVLHWGTPPGPIAQLVWTP